MEAEITLVCENKREAEAVAESVSPENIKMPLGLSVKTARRGVKISTSIKCETTLSAFIAAIDGFLSDVSDAEKSLQLQAQGCIG